MAAEDKIRLVLVTGVVALLFAGITSLGYQQAYADEDEDEATDDEADDYIPNKKTIKRVEQFCGRNASEFLQGKARGSKHM